MIRTENILNLLKYDPSSPLIFTGGGFLFLFLAFYCFLILLKDNRSRRILYITLFSLYFYYKTSGIAIFILLFMSASDYYISGRIYRSFNQRTRKFWLTVSICIDLGILIYFKYTNFLSEIFSPLLNEPFDFDHIILPAGISFFTFQSISYVVDIYRGETIKADRYIDYLFFLSFFPHILAGPIIRADKFIPQINREDAHISKDAYNTAFFLIIMGLVKKSIVSDFISQNFIDIVMDAPSMHTGFENLIAVYGYTLQIYCDFSGYSDLAIGLALLMGYRFPENFNRPYLSATPSEFWKRWHITLSRWLQDYLYVSLGGNRRSKIRTYFNLMITMLLGGLWHGASFRFVFWGFWHGLGLWIHKFLMNLFPDSVKADGAKMTKSARIIGTVLTFHFVAIGWIFFRADSFSSAHQVLKQIFTDFNPQLILQIFEGYTVPITTIILGYLAVFMSAKWYSAITEWIRSSSMVAKILMLVAICWITMQIQSTEIPSFIYFQF